MLIEEGTELGKKTIIKDYHGDIVKKVKSFDTETKEALLYAVYSVGRRTETALKWKDPNHRTLFEKDGVKSPGREVVTFKCHLTGCKAYDKHTGEEIK